MMQIPDNAKFIINKLNHRGYKAYLVGGCVRDSILGVEPKDYDIATDALPGVVLDIFNHTIPTGLKHGTVTVVMDGEHYEVTTFRIDGEYEDNRRPSSVEFTNSLKEDLSRRDLTINALAYSDEEGYIDYFGGINDIENRIIRCVGNPNERFNEDSLRILRAYRFSSKLGFDIDLDTLLACGQNSHLLKNISVERIRAEFDKILQCDVNKIYDMIESGVLYQFVPELCNIDIAQDNPYHCYTLLDHTIKATELVENSLHLKLTMLFHDLGKVVTKTFDDKGIAHYYNHPIESVTIAESILNRLKYDNATKDKVLQLIKYHDCTLSSKKSIKKMLNRLSVSMMKDLLCVKRADVSAQAPELLQKRLDELDKVELIIEDVLSQEECFSVKDLAVNGNDLIVLGVPRGRKIGEVLNRLLDIVLDNSELNNKEYLLNVISSEEL